MPFGQRRKSAQIGEQHRDPARFLFLDTGRQLDGLGQSMSGLEKKFEQVRLKKAAQAKQQQHMGKV